MNIQAELTEREEEIAEVMGLGTISQKEAANILGISIKTVDNTLQKIKEKAGISKAAELTKFCFCRKFNIPLSMCEPVKRFVAACFLSVFIFGEYVHASDLYRRTTNTRRVQTEEVVRLRRTET